MAIPTQANVTTSSMTFNDWINITNQMATALANVVITANTSLGVTVGNAYVNGNFSANTLIATQGLSGGNNSVANTLIITTDFKCNTVVNFLGGKTTLTTTTAGQAVDSFNTGTLRSAKYMIQISNSTSGYQVSEILLLQDSTNVTLTEYAQLNNGSQLGVFTATLAGSTVTLYVSPNTTSAAGGSNIVFQRTVLSV
jgi:hypothetical protein